MRCLGCLQKQWFRSELALFWEVARPERGMKMLAARWVVSLTRDTRAVHQQALGVVLGQFVLNTLQKL